MASRNWIDEAAENYKKRKTENGQRAADTLARVARHRPVLESLKKEVIRAVEEFNAKIEEQRLNVSGTEGNVLVIQSRHASDHKLGIRLDFNETAGTVTTSLADRGFGHGKPDEQKPFIGAYELIFHEDSFTWKTGPGAISSEALVERILMPVFERLNVERS